MFTLQYLPAGRAGEPDAEARLQAARLVRPVRRHDEAGPGSASLQVLGLGASSFGHHGCNVCRISMQRRRQIKPGLTRKLLVVFSADHVHRNIPPGGVLSGQNASDEEFSVRRGLEAFEVEINIQNRRFSVLALVGFLLWVVAHHPFILNKNCYSTKYIE